jgi:riboflavin kinase/FMN adenylyltransferase
MGDDPNDSKGESAGLLSADRSILLPDEEAARSDTLARPSVVAIGNFDGVHLGHQAVVAEARRGARQHGIDACALTFDPHPADVLGKGAPSKLTTLQRRADLLVRAGMDRVVVRRFEPGFAALTPEVFAQDLLSSTLRAKVVLVGENFRFGANREGDRARLEELGARLGFDVYVHAIAGDAEGPFSSTRARNAVVAGDVAAAKRVLGRWHAISGVVAHGAKLGRTLGYPTANLEAVPELLPADGVYAVVVDLLGGGSDPRGAKALAVGAMSIGLRPTIEGAVGRTVEVYLLDFKGDLYGATLRVHFVARLRDELRFEGLDALKVQMARDVADTRALTERITADVAGAYG